MSSGSSFLANLLDGGCRPPCPVFDSSGWEEIRKSCSMGGWYLPQLWQGALPSNFHVNSGLGTRWAVNYEISGRTVAQNLIDAMCLSKTLCSYNDTIYTHHSSKLWIGILLRGMSGYVIEGLSGYSQQLHGQRHYQSIVAEPQWNHTPIPLTPSGGGETASEQLA